MSSYSVSFADGILSIGFGIAASNDQIVKDATQAIKALDLKGGPFLKVNGPASLPVAFLLAHSVGHLYGVVAIFDPKLSRYVVAISHDPSYPLGTLVD